MDLTTKLEKEKIEKVQDMIKDIVLKEEILNYTKTGCKYCRGAGYYFHTSPQRYSPINKTGEPLPNSTTHYCSCLINKLVKKLDDEN